MGVGAMKFELSNSLDDNLDLFRVEAEKIDPECAKILFDNLGLLDMEGDGARDRATIGDFHKAVSAALDALPNPSEKTKS